ncbi:MAG: hypothetical protein HQK53_15925 [Oligoflexia bacterium]|nr:hypothetical protein [Oligoflexia bacterium]
MKKLLVAFLLSLTLMSCATTISPTTGKKFDPKSKVECIDICKEVNMPLQALVVVAGMSGCVCGNKDMANVSNASGVMGGAVAEIIAQQYKNNNSNGSEDIHRNDRVGESHSQANKI